jgi:hypothetical protein
MTVIASPSSVNSAVNGWMWSFEVDVFPESSPSRVANCSCSLIVSSWDRKNTTPLCETSHQRDTELGILRSAKSRIKSSEFGAERIWESWTPGRNSVPMTVVTSKLSKQSRLPELFSGCRAPFVVIVVSFKSSDPCTIEGAMIRRKLQNMVRVDWEITICGSVHVLSHKLAPHLGC